MKKLKNIKISVLVVLMMSIAAGFRNGFDWLTLIAVVCAAGAIILEVVDRG